MRTPTKADLDAHERLKAELRMRGTSLAQISRDLEQLSRAIEFWNGLRNLKSTAIALNVHPTQVKGLIEKGILRSIRFGTALRYVLAEDVDRLLAEAATLVTRNASTQIPIIFIL